MIHKFRIVSTTSLTVKQKNKWNIGHIVYSIYNDKTSLSQPALYVSDRFNKYASDRNDYKNYVLISKSDLEEING